MQCCCMFIEKQHQICFQTIARNASTLHWPYVLKREVAKGRQNDGQIVVFVLFGMLLTISEHDSLPGWPYFIAAIMAAFAWHATRSLSDEVDSQTEYYTRRKIDDYDEMEPLAGEENNSS